MPNFTGANSDCHGLAPETLHKAAWVGPLIRHRQRPTPAVPLPDSRRSLPIDAGDPPRMYHRSAKKSRALQSMRLPDQRRGLIN